MESFVAKQQRDKHIYRRNSRMLALLFVNQRLEDCT